MNLHIIFAGAVVGIALLMALLSLSSAQTKADATRPRARSLECGFGEERRALVADFRDPEPGGRVCIPSGGASRMRADHQRQLLAMFEALTLVAKAAAVSQSAMVAPRRGSWKQRDTHAAQAAPPFP